jgi:hypothetical protein
MSEDAQTSDAERPERRQSRILLWPWVVLVVLALITYDFRGWFMVGSKRNELQSIVRVGRDWGEVERELTAMGLTARGGVGTFGVAWVQTPILTQTIIRATFKTWPRLGIKVLRLVPMVGLWGTVDTSGTITHVGLTPR